MKQFISEKEFRNILIDRLSNCCGATVEYDSDICSDCKEHCGIEQTCQLCEGKGMIEIIDEMKIHSRIIDIPYKQVICPECSGDRFIEVEV